MSKFMLSATLILGSLVGFSGVGQGGGPSRPIQDEAGRSARMGAKYDVGYRDHGSFTYFTDAIPTRNHWRRLGYAANIVTNPYGKYTVRVFDK